MKFHRVLGQIVVALALLTGCNPATPPKTESARLFVISFQTLNNPFFVELNEGLKASIEARGDRLVTVDAQFNSLKQRSDVVELLERKPAVVFLNPVNWEGVKATLIEVRRREVPVIIVDAPVSDPDLVLCQIASDNVEAGRLACEALARMKPAARVVIIQHSVNKPSIDRVAGFKAEMAKHPAMRILDTQEGRGSSEGSRRAMQDLLTRFQDLDAVFPINDPSALGCIAAIEAAGRAGQITIVSVDGSRQGAEAILAGKLDASVAQYPREIGRLAADRAYAYLAGQPVEKDVKVPVRLITKENAAAVLEAR
jgi:ribose transport system substrate-binding protein